MGFALTSLLVVVPLLMTALIAVAAAYFMFDRKSLAQSLCVQEAVRLQTELRRPLEKLIAMNAQSRVLRKQRRAAERALKLAKLSRHPAAIATAQANLLAVTLAQVEHRASQQSLFSEAGNLRVKYSRQLRSHLHELKVVNLQSRNFYISPLALRPVPLSSMTPDFVRAEPFGYLQQHRFAFHINLEPSFLPKEWRIGNMNQKVECSTTLHPEAKKWDVRILAASARSN